MPNPPRNVRTFARQAPYLLMGDRKEETAFTSDGKTIYRVVTVPRHDGSDGHHWSADGMEIKAFELNLIATDSSLDAALIFEVVTPDGEEWVIGLDCRS